MISTEIGAVNTDAVIMVYGYGGRPTRMQAVGIEDGVLIVRSSETGTTTGFPAKCVYVFEQGLYERIAEAHRKGRTEILSALWAEAEPYSA